MPARTAELGTVWWLVVGVAELTFAIILLASGYWWTIFVTAPATAACVYFVLRARDRSRR